MPEQYSGDFPFERDREPTEEEKERMLAKGPVDMEYTQSGQAEQSLRVIEEAISQAYPKDIDTTVGRLMDGSEPR
jgi:hypothetical protein